MKNKPTSYRNSQSFWPPVFSGSYAFRMIRFGVVLIGVLGLAIPSVLAQSGEAPPERGAAADQSRKVPAKQAWEYWSYNVRAWVVSDGSFESKSAVPQVLEQVQRLSHVADPSSWKIEVSPAPPEWNWRFMRSMNNPVALSYQSQEIIKKKRESAKKAAEKKAKEEEGLDAEKILAEQGPLFTLLELSFSELIDQLESEQVDKFVILQVICEHGHYSIAAREYDIRTRNWGAITRLETSLGSRVGPLAYRVLANAFMPITRLEKVFDKYNPVTRKNERWARARVRSIGVTKTVVRDDQGVWQVADNVSSPVWVRSTDILLPVIRRVTFQKTFESAKMVPWTFLVIQGQEGTKLECKTQSKDRVPLSGRTGTRIEKLALVIRPPNRSTEITMFARAFYGSNKPPDPLSEYTVYSRSPGQPMDIPSEVIGKTDFFGKITIPPSDNGLRLLFISSGYRGLAKLPVLPGLQDELRIELPNDEDRLFAEGVVRGLENEVKDLLAQRKVILARIEKLIERNEIGEASDLYDFYRSLNNSQKMKDKINREKSRLLVKDESQRPRINVMFSKLVEMVDRFITPQEEAKMLKMINDAKAAQNSG